LRIRGGKHFADGAALDPGVHAGEDHPLRLEAEGDNRAEVAAACGRAGGIDRGRKKDLSAGKLDALKIGDLVFRERRIFRADLVAVLLVEGVGTDIMLFAHESLPRPVGRPQRSFVFFVKNGVVDFGIIARLAFLILLGDQLGYRGERMEKIGHHDGGIALAQRTEHRAANPVDDFFCRPGILDRLIVFHIVKDHHVRSVLPVTDTAHFVAASTRQNLDARGSLEFVIAPVARLEFAEVVNDAFILFQFQFDLQRKRGGLFVRVGAGPDEFF
jgi:hypothetical protein